MTKECITTPTTECATNHIAETPEELGTARHSVYNPVTFMWLILVGVPALLLFLLLPKLSLGF